MQLLYNNDGVPVKTEIFLTPSRRVCSILLLVFRDHFFKLEFFALFNFWNAVIKKGKQKSYKKKVMFKSNGFAQPKINSNKQ